MDKKEPTAPVAKRAPIEICLHDDVRVDEYAWLRSRQWPRMLAEPSKLEPEIRRYLEDENAYTAAVMRDSEALQQTLYEELIGYIQEDDQSLPDRDGDYEYYLRYRSGKQYPIYCRLCRAMANPAAEVLLDVNREAQDQAYYRVVGFSHSPDHRYIAYCVDANGSEYYTLYLRDTHSTTPPLRLFDNLQGDVVWSADSRHLFYVTLDDAHRPDAVFRYCIGEAHDTSALVYKEKDPGFFIDLEATRSRRFIVIHCYDHASSEDWLIPSDTPDQAPQVVRLRTPNVRYRTEECRGKLVLYNNSADAENFKLSVATLDKPTVWHDIYLPEVGVLLEDFLVFNDYLVCLECCDAMPHLVLIPSAIVVHRTQAEQPHRIHFEEPCCDVSLINTFAYTGHTLRFGYSSPKTPKRIYDYDMRSRQRTLRKEQQIPSGYDASQYNVQRLWAPSDDGAEIPISVLHHKSMPLDGSAPLLLYVYGAYGLSVAAAFSTSRLALVNRGFTYAIAHVRGGMEKGFAWYRNAKFKSKKNTFKDFLACVNCLIDNRISSRGNIAIHGGSAGGMTIGYALNKAPDLFKAAIAEVPFVDVLNTMCDADLPLTPPEWQEWGNPIDDDEIYRYMKSYSPYDQIKVQPYPNMLVTAGLNDPRVSYWEPAKWVAKLRAYKKDTKQLLLKVDMEKGHAAAAGRFDYLREIAFKYAFLLTIFAKQ